LRKLLYGLLFILTSLSVIYLLINSTYFIDSISKKYLPKYNIYYESISGNPLSGITINNIKFKDKPLAKTLAISINPYKLLNNTFSVSKLHFLGVNPDTLEEMAKEFMDNNNSQDDSSKPLPVALELQDIKFTVAPFKKFGVDINEGILGIKYVRLNGRSVEVGDISQSAKSSIANLFLSGSYSNGVVHLKKMTIKSLDISKVLALTKSNKSKNSKTKESKKDKKNDSNSTALKGIIIDSFSISTKLFKYQKLLLNSAVVAGGNLKVDLIKKKLLSARVASIISTNLAKIKFASKIGGNSISFDKISIESLDINKSIGFIQSQKENKSLTKKPKIPAKKTESKNPFLPSKIYIKKLRLSSKSYAVDKLKIKNIDILGENILLNEFSPNSGKLLLELESNLAYAKLKSKIDKETLIIYNSLIKIKQGLIKAYKLPINHKALSAIVLKGKLSKSKVKIYGGLKARNLLKDKDAPKIDIKGIVFAVEGDLKSNKGFVVKTKSKVNIKPFTTLNISSLFNSKSKKFRIKAIAPKVTLKDKKISKMLSKVTIFAKGSDKLLRADISSGLFNAKILSNDFKKAKVSIKNSKKIYLKNFVDLPKELSKAYLRFNINSSINFKKPTPLNANVKLLSNLVDFKGKVKYNKSVLLDGIIKVPKNTIINRLDKNIKIYSLNNLKLSVRQKNKTLSLKAKNSLLDLTLNKNGNKSAIRLLFGASKISLAGNFEKRLTGKIHIASISNFVNDLSKFYKIEPPKIAGGLDLGLKVDKLKDVELTIASKKLKIKGDDGKSKFIKNLRAKVTKKGDEVILKEYSLEFEKIKIYAKKSSKIALKKDNIALNEFWVNDSLKLTGNYSPKKKRGKFKAKANSFKIDSQIFKGKVATDVKVSILDKRINVDGKVILLGGVIKYKIEKKRYVTDSDIVIVNKNKKKSSDDNLKLYLLVKTKTPLIFKNKDMRIKLSPNLVVSKDYKKELKLLGSVKLLKGGYYKFENKKFVLEDSAINFTGPSSNPQLNIHVVLRRYNKVIKIYIAGKASEPSLNFTSSPPMSREQILAYILFDDENAMDSSNMMSALGGALAKSVLKNMGIKIDSMIIKSNGFEVGKKISKKVTIVYDQSDEPRAILRIEHSHKFETDISVGEKSQSVDITYKKEF